MAYVPPCERELCAAAHTARGVPGALAADRRLARAGGRFSGQLFGDRDEWARTGLVVKTRAEVEELLRPFELERFEEFEQEGQTVVGKTKQWHLFHVVARKL